MNLPYFIVEVANCHGGDKDYLVELIESFKKETTDLKFIYISGYTEEKILEKGSLESGTGIIQKPFIPEVLLSRIRELLN